MTIEIGVFGGTFDPPHRGHIALSTAAVEQLRLNRLLWVLTPDPPHKQGWQITSLLHRIAMVNLTIATAHSTILSLVEADRPGPHYALDTVRIIQEKEQSAKVVYLMGGDSLRDLPTWHRPSDFIRSIHLLGVMHRPGATYDLAHLEQVLPGINEKIRFIEAPLNYISGSMIRQHLAEGKSIRRFVTTGVYKYIKANSLYNVA